MSKGVLYICHGKEYINEGLISAESVKKFCPDLHITFFCDMEFESEFVDNITIISPTCQRSKVDYIYDSPYDETLFLDTDVIIDYPIYDIFDILNRFELGICHDLARKRLKYSRVIPEYSGIPYSFSEVNTGIIIFKKCPHTEELFSFWKKYHKKYLNHCPWDQPSFRVSLWKSNVRFCIMPIEYNIRSISNRQKQDRCHHEFGSEHLTPRIYHMHHHCDNLVDALESCKKNAQAVCDYRL
jgi:hypothetical protein